MWFSIIFFTIVGVLIAGHLWETRRKRMLYQRSRSGAPASLEAGRAGHSSYYSPHGTSYGDSGAGFSGDCGGGGGGGGGSSC